MKSLITLILSALSISSLMQVAAGCATINSECSRRGLAQDNQICCENSHPAKTNLCVGSAEMLFARDYRCKECSKDNLEECNDDVRPIIWALELGAESMIVSFTVFTCVFVIFKCFKPGESRANYKSKIN